MDTPMKTSEAGKELIKRFEGVRLTAYKDAVGIVTIGAGHTSNVSLSDTITPEEADEFLAIDLHHAETAVYNAIKVPVNQNQFDALVSLTFNIGGGAFGHSTLVRVLNQNDPLHAAEQFLVWNKAGGHVIDGLTKRREAERELFLTPETL